MFFRLRLWPLTLFQLFTILARRMIGRITEYVAFLLFRAFEMQGEVEEAFGHAVIYKALDPQVLPFPISFLRGQL